jgi:hypothetical protein
MLPVTEPISVKIRTRRTLMKKWTNYINSRGLATDTVLFKNWNQQTFWFLGKNLFCHTQQKIFLPSKKPQQDAYLQTVLVPAVI